MTTITIEIEDRSMIAALHKLLGSIKGIKILHESFTKEAQEITAEPTCTYRVSPRIKALETGFVLPDDLSNDYKKELRDFKLTKYQ